MIDQPWRKLSQAAIRYSRKPVEEILTRVLQDSRRIATCFLHQWFAMDIFGMTTHRPNLVSIRTSTNIVSCHFIVEIWKKKKCYGWIDRINVCFLSSITISSLNKKSNWNNVYSILIHYRLDLRNKFEAILLLENFAINEKFWSVWRASFY